MVGGGGDKCEGENEEGCGVFTAEERSELHILRSLPLSVCVCVCVCVCVQGKPQCLPQLAWQHVVIEHRSGGRVDTRINPVSATLSHLISQTLPPQQRGMGVACETMTVLGRFCRFVCV